MTEPRVDRTPDFRYVAADAISFSFSDSGARLIFGVDEPPGGRLDQVGVVISHLTLKLIATMAELAFEEYEKRTGQKLALAPEKIAELRRVFEPNVSQTTASEPPDER
jgi:hypothetical protein